MTPPTVEETQRTVRAMVLALVVLVVGTFAVCKLQPSTAVQVPRREPPRLSELPPLGGPEIRSCDNHQLVGAVNRPRPGGPTSPISGVWISVPGRNAFLGVSRRPWDRSSVVSG